MGERGGVGALEWVRVFSLCVGRVCGWLCSWVDYLKPEEEIGRYAMEFITGGTSLSLGCLFPKDSSVGKGEWSKIPFICLNKVSGASGKKQVAGNRQGEEQDFNKLIHINRCDGQKLTLRTPQTLSLFYRNACIFLCLSFLCIHRGERIVTRRRRGTHREAAWGGGGTLETEREEEMGHTQGGSMGRPLKTRGRRRCWEVTLKERILG